MEVNAQLRQLRISPRKVRLVSGLIKGMGVHQARYQLHILVKKSSDPILKLLNSAIANAKNNFNLQEDNLFVKDVWVDEGRKIKKFLPKGFGRVSPIEKKSSHIKIVLDERVAGLRGDESVKTQKKSDHTHDSKAVKEKNAKIKNVEIKAKAKTSGASGTGKRIFQRKAI